MGVLVGEYLDIDAGPYRGAFTIDGNRFFIPCYSSSVGLYPGTVDIVGFDNGTPSVIRSVDVGINPSAAVIDNQRLNETSDNIVYLNTGNIITAE